ncbi:MAG: hypothetical protein M1436_04355 [Acidobacteria bacterium]|nr:hypothetical protein [Acidobacteriota bacterium]
MVDSRVEAFDDSKIAELLEGAQCVFLEKGRVSIELRGPGPGVVVLVGKQARQAIKAIATPHAKR